MKSHLSFADFLKGTVVLDWVRLKVVWCERYKIGQDYLRFLNISVCTFVFLNLVNILETYCFKKILPKTPDYCRDMVGNMAQRLSLFHMCWKLFLPEFPSACSRIWFLLLFGHFPDFLHYPVSVAHKVSNTSWDFPREYPTIRCSQKSPTTCRCISQQYLQLLIQFAFSDCSGQKYSGLASLTDSCK